MSQELPRPEELSAREIEILELVATGATNQQIARTLIISVNTVKAHLRNVFEKLSVTSRTEATRCAIELGLVTVQAPAPQATVEQPPAAEVAASRAPERRPPIRRSIGAAQRVLATLGILAIVAVGFWPAAESQPLPAISRFVDSSEAPSPSAEAQHLTRWQARSPLPTARSRFAQAEVGGVIYVISGLSEDGWTPSVEAYLPTEDLWERRAPKPTAVANVAAAVVDGRIYVAGGFDQTNAVRNVLEIYDPASDTWSTGAPTPLPLCAYALASTDDGFYLFGGWDGSHYLDTVYHFRTSTGTWEQARSLRVPRGFAAAATANGRIYLLGGFDGTTEYSLCESFDPALSEAGQDPWRTHMPMQAGRAGHAVAASRGVLYVVGGGWDNYLAFSERYDVLNDAWSTFESPLLKEWRTLGLSEVSLRDGTYLYAVGGWSGHTLNTVQAYQASFKLYLP